MPDRYFLETTPADDVATLAGAEAHHLIHVMRCQVGDEILLFDGSGVEFAAQVQQVGRTEVRCQIVARQEVNRELPRRVELAVALPKGDRQRWLVEKCVELGVASLAPLETERGVAQPVDKTLTRLRRVVIEASKQCGRNRLMKIAEPLPWTMLAQAETADSLRLLAHPGGIAVAESFKRIAAACRAQPIVVAVGPEGGFTAAEVELALARNWQVIDLGTRILRVETAAVMLAVVAAWA